jgi:hypothetical protein
MESGITVAGYNRSSCKTFELSEGEQVPHQLTI